LTETNMTENLDWHGYIYGAKLMHSWGFALREGVFAETKEGKCKNVREKS